MIAEVAFNRQQPLRLAAATGVSSSHVAPAAAISSRSTPVEKNPRERGDRLGSVGEEAAQPLRHGDHPLVHGHRWDDTID